MVGVTDDAMTGDQPSEVDKYDDPLDVVRGLVSLAERYQEMVQWRYDREEEQTELERLQRSKGRKEEELEEIEEEISELRSDINQLERWYNDLDEGTAEFRRSNVKSLLEEKRAALDESEARREQLVADLESITDELADIQSEENSSVPDRFNNVGPVLVHLRNVFQDNRDLESLERDIRNTFDELDDPNQGSRNTA